MYVCVCVCVCVSLSECVCVCVCVRVAAGGCIVGKAVLHVVRWKQQHQGMKGSSSRKLGQICIQLPRAVLAPCEILGCEREIHVWLI